MPSAVSSQNNYYASHHRRQSSQSQTNLPDQLGPQIQSPNRSLVFLPSTAYSPTQPVTQRSRTSSVSTPSKSNPRLDTAQREDLSNDPHDFYRHYQDPFANPSPVALHQEAIRTAPLDVADGPHPTAQPPATSSTKLIEDRTTRPLGSSRKLSVTTQISPNGGLEGAHPKSITSVPSVLRSRKSSFKDLVARFDASPEEVPPLPTQQLSRPDSRTASPMPYASGDTSHSYMPRSKRSGSRLSETSRRMGVTSAATGSGNAYNDQSGHSRQASAVGSLLQVASNPEAPPKARQLLFGEVNPTSQDLPAAPGYGISNARRRRGSEGSPMHSPNPMFPSNRGSSQLQGLPVSAPHTQGRTPSHAHDAVPQLPPDPRPIHRRANSDVSGGPSRSFFREGQSPAPAVAGSSHRNMAEASAKANAQSRIPVSTRHQRMASDSATISPTVRPAAEPKQYPFRMLKTDRTSSTPSPSGDQKPQSLLRRPRTPPQIKSPGSRGRGHPAVSGEKSPSLRANIIAPPPKISPPLRSSRPRLPVSSATTAASRAKMAEKFQTMAKQQSDRKAFRRQRPPELSDIDLKARRLKITQALGRSREGTDLNGDDSTARNSTISRPESMTASFEDVNGDNGRGPREQFDVPAVVVDEPALEVSDEHTFYNANDKPAQDQRAFTQTALKVVEGAPSPDGEDVDSPTLGHAETAFNSIPFNLNTHLLPTQDDQEPRSAVTDRTVGTEATMIDGEPQTDASRLQTPGPSLLNHISALRSRESTSPLSSTSQASVDTSDHADQMSVHLMLRDTTYLDDDEAVEKGYRHLAPLPQPNLTSSPAGERNSWTSSIDDLQESESGEVLTPNFQPSARQAGDVTGTDTDSASESDRFSSQDEFDTEHYAKDAYTIVNRVLQQQTLSGVVDQQLVDDIYHRIIQASPDLADAENVDEGKVCQLCLQELEEVTSRWERVESSQQEDDYLDPEPTLKQTVPNTVDVQSEAASESVEISGSSNITAPPPELPPKNFRSHRYKSSLDSAEDWAETSPSVGDWIQFALKSPADAQRTRQPSALAQETLAKDSAEPPSQHSIHTTNEQTEPSNKFMSKGIGSDIPRPPSHSPPPPPIAAMPSIDQTSWSAPAGIAPIAVPAPPLGRPVTALSQTSGRSSHDQQVMRSSSSAARPSTEAEEQNPEHRRLNKRRHVLKELVDTEYTYERDMRVLCDIYKQTATAAVSDEDTKIIFGNVDLVQQFSKDFLAYLKQVVKPVYTMEKSDRRKDGNRTSTFQGSAAATDGMTEMTDAEKDECTQVGIAFEASMADMEKVYTDYIRTRQAANKRLEALQSSAAVREWLKECSENSSDITNAWSLDALLVKPIQRITKYPLLLHQLLEATPDTHPDVEFIRRAAIEVTEINVRINEVKKHTELVDQVLNRKRKESDVRNGLTKAFGRRAEKLRQHVGINEMFEDPEYTKVKISYDNNIAHLFLVTRDCQAYVEEISRWVGRLCELAAAAEAWVDVGHTNYAQAESKLRQFAIVVRGINSIALPDHADQVARRILQPMEKTATMLEKFKTDPKGLIQKREKRLLDYNQFKNKKDRGEKVDKKMTERMEQWEALNLEAKERMKRLLRSTADLVHACQASLVQLHLNWLAMCRQKFSAAMEIPLDTLDQADIIKEWQEDFDFQEATALSLGICNGSLLAEAANMVSFLTPGSTLAGDDSPRQPSWNSAAKRSISVNEEGTQVPTAELYHRNSGGPMSSQSEDPTDWSTSTFANGRIRTGSAASGWLPRTPETGGRGVSVSGHTFGTNMSRPGTSPGLSGDGTQPAPRLSVEAPSPSLGPLLTESPVAARHASSSTFYSAAPGPSRSQPNLPASRGSIFSSAMPMEDEPEHESGMVEPEPQREPGVLFTAASVYEFNIDRSRQQGGFRYLTYVTGEIFDIIAEHGELWLAINQDDETREIGWIWNKHFAKLAE